MNSIISKLSEIETAATAIVDAIQQNLTSKMNTQLQQLQSESERTIHSLTREYEIKHEQYAHEILKRITEV